MVVRAVLFDIDGTLVDSNPSHVEAWVQAFAETGHVIAPAAVAGQIGKGADNLVPALIPGIDDAGAEAIGKVHGRLFKQLFLDRVRPFPAARDLVERVRNAGLTVVLASSASSEERDHYCRLLGIEDMVDTSTTIDDVGTSKPAPDIFSVAATKAGVDPAAAIVIGDAPYDMDAASACGMARIAVRSGGFDDATLRKAGAQSIYDDAAAVLAAFDQWAR